MPDASCAFHAAQRALGRRLPDPEDLVDALFTAGAGCRLRIADLAVGRLAWIARSPGISGPHP